MMTVIDRAKEYSEAKLAALWARLAHMIPPEEMVLTCWSYARREASAEIGYRLLCHHAGTCFVRGNQ